MTVIFGKAPKLKQGDPCTCDRCGAPCKADIKMRGGDYGWGDDASRTYKVFDPDAIFKRQVKLEGASSAEPTLHFMIRHYYTAHDMPREKVERLTEELIAKLLEALP